MADYLEHPYIRSNTIQARVYQQVLFGAAVKQNSLIVLPTGLGKTVVFIMVIAYYLDKYPDSKVIITAPTRPLVTQHVQSAKNMLNLEYDEIQVISGEISPEDRSELWTKSRVFICTPQTLRNDIISHRVNLTAINLICFDEAHRAIGDDPYVLCAQEYIKYNYTGRSLGFTASPGNKEKIFEIMDNLHLEHFEYMDDDHPLVKPYIHDVTENWLLLDLPKEFNEILNMLETEIKDFLQFLKDIGVVNSIVISNNPKSKLLLIPKTLNKLRSEISDDEFYGGMARYGQLMLFYQAVEMLETQGINTLDKYIDDKFEEFKRTNKSSLRRFTQNPSIKRIRQLVKQVVEQGILHPKISKLIEIVEEEILNNPDTRILVFANYKATTQFIVDNLNLLSKISAHRFVGQTSSSYGKGLSQKEQKSVMQDFRSGTYNLLVSTSVGEEGLDVAQCDLVVFYDVTPSATRLIQRSGRTGRARSGKVIILIAKGTRDEAYFHVSRRQRNKIKNSIGDINKELENRKQSKVQASLDQFFDGKTSPDVVTQTENSTSSNTSQSSNQDLIIFDKNDISIIYIDYRERGTSMVRKLLNQNIELRQSNLPVGDFILSDRVAVERKTTKDFAETLIRGDLFEQLIALKTTYRKPLLLLEGEDIFMTAVSPKAIQGALSSIMIDYDIPVIYSKSEEESVAMIVAIASREQLNKKREPVIRNQKTTDTVLKEQLFLISSLPNVNQIIAERILREFKTPRAFFNASQNDLKKIHGIGTQIAQRLQELLDTSIIDSEDLS